MGVLDASALTAAQRRHLLYSRRSRQRQTMYEAPVMASPPTITASAVNAATAISGGTLVSPKTASGVDNVTASRAPYRWEGGRFWDELNNGMVAPYFQVGPTNGTRGTTQAAYRVAFDFYGSKWEVKTAGGGSIRQLMGWCNEQAMAASAIAIPGTSGTFNYLFDFGSRAWRRIVLELSGGAYFGGIFKTSLDDLRPPAFDSQLKLAVVGDSFSAGLSGSSPTTSAGHLGYAPRLAKLLGIPDVAVFGVSGTGFTATNTGANSTFGQRAADIVAFNPDIVLVQGSLNDGTSSFITTEDANARALISALKAALPQAVIFLSGVLMVRQSGGQANNTANDVVLAQVASDLAVPFIQPLAWAAIGFGKVGAEQGNSPSDFWCAPDGTHPTIDGHQWIAERYAGEIRNYLAAGS